MQPVEHSIHSGIYQGIQRSFESSLLAQFYGAGSAGVRGEHHLREYLASRQIMDKPYFSRILPFKMLLNSKLSLNKQNVAAGFEKTNSAATFCILFTYSPDVLTFSAHAVTSIKSAYPTSSGKIVTVCGTYVIINNTISSTPNCGSRSFI